MNLFVNIVFLFFIGGVGGYFIELIYRRLAHHRFINPGFLHGPFLPIYGFGLLLLFGLCSIPLNINIMWVKIFIRVVLIFASLTVIEYLGGLIFIKILNIRLWDYSKLWGNIQGIICPLFSLIWGILGTLYYLILHPLLVHLLQLTDGNTILYFIMGIFIGILIIDFIQSFKVAQKIGKILKSINLHIPYDALKIKLKLYANKHNYKTHFFKPFHNLIDKIHELK